MGTGVWLESDIRNILQSMAEAGRQQAALGASLDYQRGFAAALRQLSAVAGVDPAIMNQPTQPPTHTPLIATR